LSGVSGTAALTVTAPVLKSITVTPAAPSIAGGTTTTFTASGTNTDGSTAGTLPNLSWTSGTPTVATISATGVASALLPGTTVITATSGSISGTATLTVTLGALTAITITPAAPTLIEGNTEQLVATGSYAGGATQNISSSVTWTPPSVATISPAGVATAGTTVGSGPVTATSGSITSPAVTLTVAPYEYVYSVNFGPATAGASTLAQFSVGSGGELVPLTPATVVTGVQPFGVTVDPTSSYVYVTDYATESPNMGTVSQYTIGATGQLTPMTQPTVPSGTGPQSLAIATIAAGAGLPATDYAYVANYGDGTVSQYRIGAGGALSPLTPAATVGPPTGTSNPAALAVDPTNSYVYVVNYGSNNVSQWAIGTGGALTPLANPTVAAGAKPTAIAFDPVLGTNGSPNYVYVTNSADNTVSEYRVTTGGGLTPLSTSSIKTGLAPTGIAIDPTGKYLYVTNDTDATVSQYSIDATTGVLTSIGAAVATQGVGPSSIVVDPTSQYVYVADRGTVTGAGVTLDPATTLSMFSIGANGALTLLTVPTATPGLTTSGTAPVGVTTTHK